MSESVPFEGVEKRLVIQFAPEAVSGFGNSGVDPAIEKIKSPYMMSEEEWQEILDEAKCAIVSKKVLGDHKVYLLSESTLTVWPTGFLIKTCGRTTPFLALKALLRKNGLSSTWAERYGVNWMTYSRLQFIHPQYQIYPHQNFQQELDYLQSVIFPTDDGRSRLWADTIPQGPNKLHFVFYCSANQRLARPYYMTEALMTGVDIDCVRKFTGYDNHSERISSNTNHQQLSSPFHQVIDDHKQKGFRTKQVDEFWFDPCGYSANALFQGYSSDNVEYFSCHISPEHVTSYASLEIAAQDYLCPASQSAGFTLRNLMPSFNARSVQFTRVHVTDDASAAEEEDADRVFVCGSVLCIVSHSHYSSPDDNNEDDGLQQPTLETNPTAVLA